MSIPPESRRVTVGLPVKKRRGTFGPDSFKSPEAYQAHLAYDDMDVDRMMGYVDRMLERAGWDITHRPSTGCILEGGGGGLVSVNYVDLEFAISLARPGRSLVVTAGCRDLDRVPAPGARVASDLLRAVRNALS